MKNQIFKFLKSYSTHPFEVDRLIVSTYIIKNQLDVQANKLLKIHIITPEEECEFEKLGEFVDIVNSELGKFDLEDLVEVFEFVISPSDRIINGAIYTPIGIREYIVKQVFDTKEADIDNVKVSDISCGCGGFLLVAAQELKKRTLHNYSYIYRNQIFGIDIQDYSITRTKLLLSLLAFTEGDNDDFFDFNLHKGDTLTFNWLEIYDDYLGFDIIVGNPPYVCARNLSDDTKQSLKTWSVCKAGNPDLYIPFFQIGIESLAENGILGYITMNTFFKSLNGRALRGYFKERTLDISIVDFGTHQIFKSRSTYTCICFIKNHPSEYVKYYPSTQKHLPKYDSQFQKVQYSQLDSIKGWNLNDNIVIQKIESTGIPLGKQYKTRHGIATLKNSIYIFKPVSENEQYFYIEVDGIRYPIERNICRDIVNSNKLNGTIKMEDIVEKVIFPYMDNGQPKSLSEDIFCKMYPMAYKYLKKFRPILDERDKGKGKYEHWFSFGRTQSLEKMKYKLFFPKISNKAPSCIINSDQNMLFYNGQAVIGKNRKELFLIKKIMESRLFWFYIKKSSKPYSSSYYSLNGNYIKNFGIYEFSKEEVDYIIKETDMAILNIFIENKYGVKLSDE